MDIDFRTMVVGIVSKPWKSVKFICIINGQDFEYHLGMGYVIKFDDREYIQTNYVDWARKANADGYETSVDLGPKGCGLVKLPVLENVLNSLFMDSTAHDVSFTDWCNEFGYNNDSINDRKIYDRCIDNYFKLKKALGSKYGDVKAEIEALGL